MCISCWEEYGSPRIDTAEIRAAVVAVTAVYGESPVGGNLHVVLDDWNIEDEHVRGWIDYAAEPITEAERACGAALARLTESERASALAIYDGFWNPETFKEPA